MTGWFHRHCHYPWYHLGRMYIFGRGVEKDQTKGYGLLLNAAEQGDTNAIYDVAFGFLVGLYEKRDMQKAKNLFLEAAEKGRFPLATPKLLVWVRSTCIVYKSHLFFSTSISVGNIQYKNKLFDLD